jgi:hypothetical protein
MWNNSSMDMNTLTGKSQGQSTAFGGIACLAGSKLKLGN